MQSISVGQCLEQDNDDDPKSIFQSNWFSNVNQNLFHPYSLPLYGVVESAHHSDHRGQYDPKPKFTGAEENTTVS